MSSSRAQTAGKLRGFIRSHHALQFVGIGAAFLLLLGATYGLSVFHERRHEQTAEDWFKQGEAALQCGNVNDAIGDLQTALSYSRDNRDYLFTLAQALEKGGHDTEARAYFLGLWEDAPGSGEINLELAHLAVRAGETNDAIRYYNSAVYGAWTSQAPEHRRDTREELVRFLLMQRRYTQARAELLALTPDLPLGDPANLWVAQSFLATTDAENALTYFRRALRRDPHNQQAILGAGTAAFDSDDYPVAERYLRSVSTDANAQRMLTIMDSMAKLNAFSPSLSYRERRERLIAGMQLASQHMTACGMSPTPPLLAPEPTKTAAAAAAKSQVAAPTSTAAAKATPPAQPAGPPAPPSLPEQWQALNAQLQSARNADQVRALVEPIAQLIIAIEQRPGCATRTPDDEALFRSYQRGMELAR